jgi:Ca2+-binding EF-hand superfamily protein
MLNNYHRSFILSGAALMMVHAGMSVAQTTPSKAERGDHGRAQWQQADLDKDGQLSKAEVQAAGMRHLVERFDAIDTNKDGKISEAEMSAWMRGRRDAPAAGKEKPAANAQNAAPGAAASDKDGMGYKTPDQRRAAMQERFNKADTNKDGGLSRAELQAVGNQRLLDNFDAIDTNKDGKITMEEMRAAWERRQ